MKKLCILLLAVLLLCQGATAFAEDGVEIAVIDGIPVVVESVGETPLFLGDGAGFTFPAKLVRIEEEAFAGIPAARVEITGNVTTIGARAFADCPNLAYILMPSGVTVDPTAIPENVAKLYFDPAD